MGQPEYSTVEPEPVHPPRRRMTVKSWVGAGAAVVTLLCCGLGAIGVIFGDDERKGGVAASAEPSPPAAVSSRTASHTLSAPVSTAAEPVTTTAPAPIAPTSPSIAARPAKPKPKPAPALPKDETYSGRGDKVLRLSLPAGQRHFAEITHSGDSNFAVWSLDSGGDNVDLLVNEVGAYSGARPLDFEETPAALKVSADGGWKVIVRVLAKAPIWPKESSGKGAAVLQLAPGVADGLVTADVTHRGSSNFVMKAYGDGRDLLINEIGGYDGEILIPSGTSVLEIDGDGAWTIRKSS